MPGRGLGGGRPPAQPYLRQRAHRGAAVSPPGPRGLRGGRHQGGHRGAHGGAAAPRQEPREALREARPARRRGEGRLRRAGRVPRVGDVSGAEEVECKLVSNNNPTQVSPSPHRFELIANVLQPLPQVRSGDGLQRRVRNRVQLQPRV